MFHIPRPLHDECVYNVRRDKSRFKLFMQTEQTNIACIADIVKNFIMHRQLVVDACVGAFSTVNFCMFLSWNRHLSYAMYIRAL